jgi:hypothetical protein
MCNSGAAGRACAPFHPNRHYPGKHDPEDFAQSPASRHARPAPASNRLARASREARCQNFFAVPTEAEARKSLV